MKRFAKILIFSLCIFFLLLGLYPHTLIEGNTTHGTSTHKKKHTPNITVICKNNNYSKNAKHTRDNEIIPDYTNSYTRNYTKSTKRHYSNSHLNTNKNSYMHQ